MQRRKIVAVLLLFLCLFLSACGYEEEVKNVQKTDVEEQIAIEENNDVMQSEVLEEAPVAVPNVLVDQIGYDVKERKVVYFRGEDLKKEFDVIDYNTGETVFSGTMKDPVLDEETKTYLSEGDFSAHIVPGTYYIQTAIIGQSYTFAIGDEIYVKQLENIAGSFYKQRCNNGGGWHTGGEWKDTIWGAKTASNILWFYELADPKVLEVLDASRKNSKNPDLLSEVKFEAEWLLKMQNITNGGVYPGSACDENCATHAFEETVMIPDSETISPEATGEFAIFMAQAYRLYKDNDQEFATNCLYAAEKAYGYLSNNTEDSSLKYYAAAQLYKSTGNQKYVGFVVDYYHKNKMNLEAGQEDPILAGNLTYLTTTYRVDVDLCQEMMGQIMDLAEVTASHASQNSYFVCGTTEKRTTSSVIENMSVLSLADKVVSTNEYLSYILSGYHYLNGRNPSGEYLLTPEHAMLEEQIEEYNVLYLQSKLLFVLSEIVGSEEMK